MRSSASSIVLQSTGIIVGAFATLLLATAALADNKHRGHAGRENPSYDARHNSDHDRHGYRREHPFKYSSKQRHHSDRHYQRGEHAGYAYRARPDWHFHRGRYWAPPAYRGRYCVDRYHHHRAHYHVAARDCYDYYHPRYRHYGSLAAPTVIISIPLF